MANEEFYQPNNVTPEKVKSVSVGFLPKVFIFFGIGILLSALISLAMPYAYQAFGWIDLSKVTGIAVRAYGDGLLIMMISTLVILFIFSLVNQLVLFKRGAMHPIMYFLYCIIMGIAISFTSMFVDFYTFAIAFGVSALAFILMGLIGYFSKGHLKSFAVFGIALFICSAVLSLFNWFIFGSNWLYWIITFATLFGVLLFTSFDVRMIKTYQESQAESTGLAIFCAFVLYNDFIYIFLRILQIAAVLFNKSNN